MKRKDFLPAPVSFWSVVFIIVGGILTAGSVQAAPPARPLLAACVVNNTNDSGPGSLRQCLMNAHNGDTITFNPSVFPPGSPATIPLTSALPEITQGSLTIDGTGAGVILSGSAMSGGNGFSITSNGNTIRGLQILSFPGDGIDIRQGASSNTVANNVISGNGMNGVLIQNSGTNYNTVTGNYLGTNANGTAPLPNQQFGVLLDWGAQYNTVGGTTPVQRNVISGNGGAEFSGGLGIFATGTNNNTVIGNYIGVNAAGTAALSNTGSGVHIGDGAYNVIGGDTASERNLISGNGDRGIVIESPDAMGNIVSGNYIGTDVSGTIGIGNAWMGVNIRDGAQANIIGGRTAGERNIISSNGFNGIGISDADTDNNLVIGNYIGTDVSGTIDLGNADDGVRLDEEPEGNIVGGAAAGERNIISGNGREGVDIGGADNNLIIGNYIGTDVSGTAALGNAERGIGLNDGGKGLATTGNTIQGNLISGNGTNGIDLWSLGTENNVVIGNYIGTDVTGLADLGNGDSGIYIGGGARNNIIGGLTPQDRNIISGNGFLGISIGDAATMNNTIRGNYIGTDVSGSGDLGNTLGGIFISDASGNVIGGSAPGADNLIAFNDGNGILIRSGSGNAIHSNAILSNGSLGIDLGIDGVTSNDPGDGDAGANNLQNFPALTSAETGGSDTLINVTFNSRPNTTYTFEFFANNACDPSNYGEGATFLTSATRTTASSGDVSFTVVSSTTVPVGQFITATATDPNGNTSEFSQCVLVQAQALDGQVGTSGGTVVDTAGTGAAFNVPPTVLPEKTDIFVQVISEPEISPPSGFVGLATALVNITLEPNPSPLPAPGATIILPLNIPLAPGISVPLFKYDSTTNTLINTGKVGTVNPGGVTATFSGVTDFSIFTGLSNIKKIYLPIIVK